MKSTKVAGLENQTEEKIDSTEVTTDLVTQSTEQKKWQPEFALALKRAYDLLNAKIARLAIDKRWTKLSYKVGFMPDKEYDRVIYAEATFVRNDIGKSDVMVDYLIILNKQGRVIYGD